MKYVIDRFEGKFAVCEGEMKKTIQVPKYRLPLEAKEGDWLVEKDGMFFVDDEETKRQQKKAREIMNRLFQ